MRAAANTFLVLFLIDTALSLADDLLGATLGSGMLGTVRSPIAAITALAGLLTYVALGITPRLPKRVFLPLTLFTIWTLFGAMPIPLYFGRAWSGVALSAFQGLLGVLALVLVQRMTAGQSWLLSDEALAGPSFSGRNSLVFFGGNLVLGPIVLALYLGVSFSLAVEHFTAGFFHVDFDGLRAEERQYVRGDRQVHLIAMMHIANRDYYEEVLSDLPVQDAVVLAEGVTDEQQLMPEGLSYGKLAARLGLDAQEDVAMDTGAHVIEGADVDLTDFSPSTLELLRAISRVTRAEDLATASLAYRQLSELTSRPDTIETALAEIIELRNEHLLEHIRDALGEYSYVIVPWGAAHMPAIEEALFELGFELSETRERNVIQF